MKKLWVLLVLPALLLLWWAAERKSSIPEIHFARATRDTIASTIPTNGKVEPVEFAAALAEAAGVVRSILVERGQDVSSGQTLVILDNVAERAAVNSAQALVNQAQADQSVVQQGGRASELSDVESSLRSARLQLQEAERNLNSTRRLFDKQAATQQEVLNSQDAVARAKLQIQSLESPEANHRQPGGPKDQPSKTSGCRGRVGTFAPPVVADHYQVTHGWYCVSIRPEARRLFEHRRVGCNDWKSEPDASESLRGRTGAWARRQRTAG